MLIGPRYASMSGAGSPYVCRYLRMSIGRTWEGSSVTAVLKVALEDAGGNPYAWPAGTAVTVGTTDEYGTAIPIENPSAQNILTGAGDGFTCEWSGPGDGHPLDITIDLGGGNAVDTSAMCIWRWYETDKVNQRIYPDMFDLLGSADGRTWRRLDSRGAGNEPLARKPDGLTYSGFIGRRIQYLESSGTQYIDTGLSDEYYYGYELSLQPVGDLVENGAMFGVRTGNLAGSTGIGNVPGDAGKIGVWKDSDVVEAIVDRQEFNSIFIKPPVESETDFISEFTVNHDSYTLKSYKTEIFQSEDMYLFAANGAEGERQPCRMAGYAVVGGDSTSGDYHAEMGLIPVSVGGEGMMFDKVSGRLFGNAGTGSFTRGPEIPPLEAY